MTIIFKLTHGKPLFWVHLLPFRVAKHNIEKHTCIHVIVRLITYCYCTAVCNKLFHTSNLFADCDRSWMSDPPRSWSRCKWRILSCSRSVSSSHQSKNVCHWRTSRTQMSSRYTFVHWHTLTNRDTPSPIKLTYMPDCVTVGSICMCLCMHDFECEWERVVKQRHS